MGFDALLELSRNPGTAHGGSRLSGLGAESLSKSNFRRQLRRVLLRLVRELQHDQAENVHPGDAPSSTSEVNPML